MTMLSTPDEASLGGRWKLFFGVGAVLAILGVLALMNVVSATLVTAFLVGVLLLVGGLAQVVAAFMMSSSAGMRILTGLLGVLYLWIGANIIAEPLKGVLLITGLAIGFFLGIELLMAGVLWMVLAWGARDRTQGAAVTA